MRWGQYIGIFGIILVFIELFASIQTVGAININETDLGSTENVFPLIIAVFDEQVKIDTYNLHSSTAVIPISQLQGENCLENYPDYCINWTTTPALPLPRDNHTLELLVEDLYGNQLLARLYFEMINDSLVPITLLSPLPAGFSSKPEFNFSIGTGLTLDKEDCRYKIYNNPSDINCDFSSNLNSCFLNLNMFDESYSSDDSTVFRVELSGFTDGDYSNTAFVMCNSSTLGFYWNYFGIGYDSTPPSIDARASPDLVTDFSKPFSTIIINSDDPITCKAECINNPNCEKVSTTSRTAYASNNFGDYYKEQYITIDFREADLGDYDFEVSCINPAGLTNTTIIENISYQPETYLSIIWVSPDELVAEDSFKIEVMTPKLKCGDLTCEYSLDNSGPQDMDKYSSNSHYIFNDTITGIEDGQHEILVNCSYQLAGYSTYRTMSRSFRVDTTPPSIEILDISDPSCSLSTIWFKVNTSDEVSGVRRVYYNITLDGDVIYEDDVGADNGEKKITVSNLGLLDGYTYDIIVWAEDRVGYASSIDTASFEATNSSDPRCDYTRPSTSYHAWNCTQGLCVNITCSDTGSGCSDEFYYSNHTNISEPCSYDNYGSLSTSLPIILYESSKLCWVVYDNAGHNASMSQYFVVTQTPSQPDHCNNGVKDSDETDIDCGGSCSPCGENKSCNSDNDCEYGLECYENICQPFNPDRDGDDINDDWEEQYCNGDCDPDEDLDDDGLTNLEEYNYRTDPLNPDTDGDGVSDGEELSLIHI